jgi:hypothetical protein
MLLERVKSDRRFHTSYKEAVICSRFIRIFITSCLYILYSEDVLSSMKKQVEGVE